MIASNKFNLFIPLGISGTPNVKQNMYIYRYPKATDFEGMKSVNPHLWDVREGFPTEQHLILFLAFNLGSWIDFSENASAKSSLDHFVKEMNNKLEFRPGVFASRPEWIRDVASSLAPGILSASKLTKWHQCAAELEYILTCIFPSQDLSNDVFDDSFSAMVSDDSSDSFSDDLDQPSYREKVPKPWRKPRIVASPNMAKLRGVPLRWRSRHEGFVVKHPLPIFDTKKDRIWCHAWLTVFTFLSARVILWENQQKSKSIFDSRNERRFFWLALTNFQRFGFPSILPKGSDESNFFGRCFKLYRETK